MSLFPNNIDSFSTKQDNVDDVFAADVNDIQDSVIAIESFFGSGLSNFVNRTGDMIMDSGTTFASNISYIQSPFNAVSDTLTITSIGSNWAWAPSQTLLEINSMNVISGNLYVGGAFSEVDGVMRTGLAAFDISDNYSLTSWAPLLIPPQGTTMTVNKIISSPNGIIVGGKFSGVNATTRISLAEVDLAGNLTSFYNSLLASGVTTEVRVAVITGNYLYVGGFIPSVSGNSTYKHLVAFDKHTGELNYQYTPGGFGAVNDIFAVESGIYVAGGNVENISGTDGGPITNPLIDYSGNGVISLSNLFSGSSFTTIVETETPSNELCIFYTATGKVVFYPQMYSLTSPTKYNYITKEVSPFSTYLNVSVNKAIEYSGVIFYIGGTTLFYGDGGPASAGGMSLGLAGMNVGAIDAVTGNPKNFALDLDQPPSDMLIYDNKLYLCGQFRGFQHNKQLTGPLIAIDLPDSLFN